MSQAVTRHLDTICERGNLRLGEVARMLGTTAQTVSRWRNGRSRPPARRLRRLLATEWIVTQLWKTYGADEARLWLYAPHRDLHGLTPAELLAIGKDVEVRIVLTAATRGGFG
jgi:transcriptional regulator with XRE-family HTH domain